MTRIVAIGECMVEMAPTGRAGEFQMGFAGDTMNTAWYLRRLLPEADRVDYLTAIGTDAVSDQMLAFLADAGIGTAHVFRRDDLTVGLYMIQLAGGERGFSYWRSQSAARTLARDSSALTRALADAQVAFFSGITLAILPADDRSRLLGALKQFRGNGGEVVFDPNLRPRLWQSSDMMMAAVMQAASVSDTVLPSYEDEATWFGDADPAATAARYADSGARMVVVKNGSGPVTCCENGMVNQHDAANVTKVVDTTAAGDSFNAAFLATRLGGQATPQAIDAACRLAAKVVQSRGALIAGIC